tara:strand:+ start:3441 stop:4187 length:747 start_codon:yes stop_codon:yes gene_type:complete
LESTATVVQSPLQGGDLAERLGIKPLPGDLLCEALTHASYPNESSAEAIPNERLEFLGDAVLGMVVANELFRAYPEAAEGELTRMRAEIVRGSTLAKAARRLDLGGYLILGRGEESAGGRDRDRNLAGAFEALLGAVYRAHGLTVARALSLRLLKPEINQMQQGGPSLDPKSALQHLVQARWHKPPEYVTVDEQAEEEGRRFVVEVSVSGKVLGRGTGSSKRAAQNEAARKAQVVLSSDAVLGIAVGA